MGMTAATIHADLARPDLVPGLRHVQHHAILVERLEGEGGVGGNSGEKARVWIAVGVERLLAVLKFAQRDFAENAKPLVGMAGELPSRLEAAVAVSGWLHAQD